ncbi:MAG: hypothetical protein NZ957_00780 [Thaumarchaeota archaeon]|nr:hypothetical protein [Candidatus Calditenuaceae archaeon]MDW8042316.1 hypothetical protein [Nitrososphaerota archaeon]
MARDLLIVETKVRQMLPEGIRLKEDALEGLNEVVKEAVLKAVKRCQANDRKTIIKEDF